MDLFNELCSLLSDFHSENVEYALCGGLAMAVYAFPRSTLDIDIMIREEDLERVKKIVKQLGFVHDSGKMSFKKGAVKIYRMTKLDQKSQEPLILDMLLVTNEIKDVWESRRRVVWDQGFLWVVSPEGLIRLKSIRSSGQDQDDINNLRSLLDED